MVHETRGVLVPPSSAAIESALVIPVSACVKPARSCAVVHHPLPFGLLPCVPRCPAAWPGHVRDLCGPHREAKRKDMHWLAGVCRPGSALHSAVKRAIGSERESPGGPGAVSYVHTYTRCARYRLPHWNGNTRAGRGGRLYLESSQAGRRKELAWLGGARRGAAGMCLARPVWVTGRRPRLTVQPLPKTFSPGRRGPRAIVPGRGSLLTAAPACTPPKVKLVELMGLISGSSSIEWLRYSAVQWYSVRCGAGEPRLARPAAKRTGFRACRALRPLLLSSEPWCEMS